MYDADTFLAALIKIVQLVELPTQAPLQVLNVYPEIGTAVRVIDVPEENAEVQVVLQLTPDGETVTLPPVELFIVSSTGMIVFPGPDKVDLQELIKSRTPIKNKSDFIAFPNIYLKSYLNIILQLCNSDLMKNKPQIVERIELLIDRNDRY